jgi:uncharacterized protein YhfF
MMANKSTTFTVTNTIGTRSFHFDSKKIPMPRVGDHVVILDDSSTASTVMEGRVTQITWIIGKDTKEFGAFVVIEEGKVPDDYI